jgi:hypothetical protein
VCVESRRPGRIDLQEVHFFKTKLPAYVLSRLNTVC